MRRQTALHLIAHGASVATIVTLGRFLHDLSKQKENTESALKWEREHWNRGDQVYFMASRIER